MQTNGAWKTRLLEIIKPLKNKKKHHIQSHNDKKTSLGFPEQQRGQWKKPIEEAGRWRALHVCDKHRNNKTTQLKRMQNEQLGADCIFK